MLVGVKDYRGQRHIKSHCTSLGQSSPNLKGILHSTLTDFKLLLGG